VSEAARLRYAELAPGWDVLFIARGPAATASWDELREAVDALLRRATLLPPREPAR